MTQLWVPSILAVLVIGWHQAAGQAPPPPAKLLRFAAVFDGEYTNDDQVKADERNHFREHTRMKVNYRPVTVPALFPKFSFYVREEHGDVVKRQHIVTAELDPDTRFIVLTPYNLTDPSRTLSKNFDPEIFANLQTSDLELRDGCQALIQELEENVFQGSWPDCSQDVHGLKPAYTIRLTCVGFEFVVAWKSVEKPHEKPYTLTKIKSYGLPAYMTQGAVGYKNPCQRLRV